MPPILEAFPALQNNGACFLASSSVYLHSSMSNFFLINFIKFHIVVPTNLSPWLVDSGVSPFQIFAKQALICKYEFHGHW
jgi:hypothetical protein